MRECIFCNKMVLYAHNPIYFGLVRMCDGYHPKCQADAIEGMLKADSHKTSKENKE